MRRSTDRGPPAPQSPPDPRRRPVSSRRIDPLLKLASLRSHRGALIVAAVAILARIVTLLQARQAPFWSQPIVDETAYLQLAQSLLNGQGPPHGAYYQAPGYAFFLAGVLAMGGGVVAAKVIQLAAGVVNCLLVRRLGRAWFGEREGTIAGLLWAIYPVALFHEVLLLKPTLAVLFSLLALNLILPQPRIAAYARWATCGVCLGIASLLQGEIAGVAVLVLIVAALIAPAGRRGWRALAAAAIAFIAVLAVPTAQNIQRGGGAVVVAYGGGVNFYIGNHAGADGGYLPLRPDRGDAALEEADAFQMAGSALGHAPTAAEVSRYWWRQGLRWWGQDPLGALRLTLKKLALIWGPREIADVLDTGMAARWLWLLRDPIVRPVVLLPAALVGLWLARRRRELWAGATFVIGSTLVLAPFFVFERFRLPMTAACLPLSAHAATRLWDAVRARRLAPAAAGLGATAALALLVGLPSMHRDRTVLRVNVGDALMQAGRFEEALAEFEAVRAANPAAFRVEINIAWAQAMLHRSEDALRTLGSVIGKLRAEERASGRTPVEELVSCYALSGDLLLSAGRAKQAADSFKAALSLQPGHPVLLQKLKAAESFSPR